MRTRKILQQVRLGVFLILTGAAVHAADIPLAFQWEVLAKAVPDECYFGIGNPSNSFSPAGIDVGQCLAMGGRPKVNQAYVWGLAKAGDDLWIGTGANVNSLVAGSYLDMASPSQNPTYVAEFGSSAFATAGVVPPALGDWRPPGIFVRNLRDGSLTRLVEVLPDAAQALLNVTLGLRSAGTSAPNGVHSNGVVFLAGPRLPQPGSASPASSGVVMFAFDARTRAFIGARAFPEFVNIRKWLLHEGVLYTAVTRTDGSGRVLRWGGDPAAPEYPFAFTAVGNLDSGGADLAVHEGRMFVSTWPPWETPDAFDAGTLLFNRAGVYMSVPLPPGGLTAAHAGAWVKFWDTSDYDPDTVCSAVTGIGGLRSFGGHLYWGTMNIPLLTARAHTLVFGSPTNNAESNQLLVNSWRAISIFRATDFRFGAPRVRLLYGETNLASRSLFTGAWRTNYNASGQTPLFGRSGMGSFNNLYTWTMAEYRGQLFLGTLNISGVITRFDASDGAHLFCFPSPDEPARPVSLRGVGNPANYGVRTMLSDSNGLYLGMANPMNLLTSTNGPRGGWELMRLVRRYDDADWDGLSDEFESAHFGGPTNGVPTMDSDGDGVNDLAEFRAGSNPTNRFDLLSLNALTMSPGGEFSFNWFGAAGRVYHVQQRAHLNAASNAWSTIGSVTGHNAQVNFTPPADSTQGWFRVEAQFQPVGP